MSGKRKHFFFSSWPLLVFLLIFFVFFYKVFFSHLLPLPSDLLVSWYFPYALGGWNGYSPAITHKEFIASDVIRQLYPWKNLAVSMLKSGQFPLWNPYAFSGTPLLANLQSAVFYPTIILFFFLPFQTAWVWNILSQSILAVLFMYLFLRSLHLSRSASFFGGIAFAFMGYMNIWFEWGVVGHTAVWLPFVLFGLTKFSEKKQKKFLLFSSIGLAMSLFAGHAQTAGYIYVLSFIYALWMIGKRKRELFTILWVFLLGIGLGAVQLLPSLELLSLSARDVPDSTRIFHYFQLPLQHLLTIFAPDFFGNPAVGNFWGKDYGEFMAYFGIVALTFAAIALWNKRHVPTVRFFFIVSGIALLFAVPFIFSESLLFFHIPIFGTGVPARTLFLFEFSFVVIAAYGVEAFITQKKTFTHATFVTREHLCFYLDRSFIFLFLSYTNFFIYVNYNAKSCNTIMCLYSYGICYIFRNKETAMENNTFYPLSCTFSL